jgi:hypothetical protein
MPDTSPGTSFWKIISEASDKRSAVSFSERSERLRSLHIAANFRKQLVQHNPAALDIPSSIARSNDYLETVGAVCDHFIRTQNAAGLSQINVVKNDNARVIFSRGGRLINGCVLILDSKAVVFLRLRGQ